MGRREINLRAVKARLLRLESDHFQLGMRSKFLFLNLPRYHWLTIFVTIGIFTSALSFFIRNEEAAKIDGDFYAFPAALFAAALCLTYAWFSMRVFRDSGGRSLVFSACVAVFMTLIFASLYERFGLEAARDLGKIDYIYFSLVTSTTLGYGDITPSPASQGIAVVNALFGLLFFALIVAKLIAFGGISTSKNRRR